MLTNSMRVFRPNEPQRRRKSAALGYEQGAAPPPDHEHKPQTPPGEEASWNTAFARLSVNSPTTTVRIRVRAEYYGVLSLFPGLLALVSSLSWDWWTGRSNHQRHVEHGGKGGAGQAVNVIRQPIEQLASSQERGWRSLSAWWVPSGLPPVTSMLRPGHEQDLRGRRRAAVLETRPVMLLITIVVLLLAVLMMLMLVLSGPVAQAVGSFIGLGDVAVTVWNIAKWPLLVRTSAVLMIAVLYYATPNVKQPKFRWISLGALIALVVLASLALPSMLLTSAATTRPPGHWRRDHHAAVVLAGEPCPAVRR